MVEEETNRILVAKTDKMQHTGRLFGTIKNGGMFVVGNFDIEIIANGSNFVTIQIYQRGIGVAPTKQYFVPSAKNKEQKQKDKRVEEAMERLQTEVGDVIYD
jgi:hypothetical protein